MMVVYVKRNELGEIDGVFAVAQYDEIDRNNSEIIHIATEELPSDDEEVLNFLKKWDM